LTFEKGNYINYSEEIRAHIIRLLAGKEGGIAMELKDCVVVAFTATDEGASTPYVMAIVVAPTEAEAEVYVKRELAPFLEGHSYDNWGTQTICQIPWSSTPTTLFLWTHGAGRIK